MNENAIHPEPREEARQIASGMTLADISIRNHVFAWMLMAGLIVFGAISFQRLGVSQNPDVDFPVVTASLTYEGASPEIMETDVVDFVEDALIAIEGVREISSTCKQGQASVTVEFELGRNIDAALQDVQTRIAQAQRRLPRELDPPVVTKSNPEDQPILWLALYGNRPPQEVADYVRNVLKNEFQTIPGVGEVSLGGYRERNIRVWLDPGRLEAYQLTAQDVVDAIQRQHLEVPAGRIETSEREMNVRAEGEALNVDQFRSIVIEDRGGAPIYLRDVAVVEDGLEDKRRISRAMGEPALGFGIRKLRGANAVEVGRAVKAKVEEVRKRLPEGLSMMVNWDGTRYIEESVREIEFTLLLAVILTGVVCWLFLGSWSSTVNILLAIPTSIIGTFIVIYFLGFTLNTFTLLGLTLTVGIVVDDAIMVLENIYRHRERGEGKIKAASVGAREITFAATAATAAIVAIFLPVAFMKGIIGRFFFEFGVTISVAVLLSLLEALTLTPMRCSQFLEVGERIGRLGSTVDRGFRRLSSFYARTLAPSLHHRWRILAAALVIFVVSLGILRIIGREFIPSQDQSGFMVRFQTPVGTSIDATDQALAKMEKLLAARPEMERYLGVVGGFGGGEVNTGLIFVTMKEKGQRPVVPPAHHPLSQQEFMSWARSAFNSIPGLRATIMDPSQGGFTARRGYPVEISVRGPDWNGLAKSARELMEKMEATGQMVDVDTDYQVGMPEVRVIPDRAKAADLGVSMATIGNTINATIGGLRVAKFKQAGRRYDIRVRLLATERNRPEDIERLMVRTKTGELVRLGDLVKLVQQPTLQLITRRNRERTISIFANVAPGASQATALTTVEKLAKETLPDGYRAVFSGSAQVFQESFQSLIFALLLGLVVAYMVLASQFNSFTHPLTVLLALPFSLTGALTFLWATGQTLNLYSMLGLILLMGIAKKNSILLVDFTNQMRERGEEREPALLKACPIRLRPILMTSTATIAGALPAALSFGPGAETRQPMALALIGGMAVSTFMTLYVVPSAYTVLDDLTLWIERRRRRQAEEELHAPAGKPTEAPAR
jgi:hydrophobe/amphiphile efflux-1 (HAE1) family protein